VSATGAVGEGRAEPASVLRRTAANLAAFVAALGRPVRGLPRPAWPAPSRLVLGTGLTVAAVAAAMVFLDSPAVGLRGGIPPWMTAVFDEITDFGKSGWFLFPAGILLLAVAALASPALGRTSYLVLMSLAARIGFVFVAVAVPSLFATIVKRLIGRARPLRIQGSDLSFAPFAWRADFASLPSGHSTTAFAAAVALGALFPRARVLFFIYAGLIAVSRVVLSAHYPSDVIAGAVVGGCGALLVRRWFAARRLAFTLRPDNSVGALPGPSLQRIKKVARRVAGQ
jgi:membrane-associated phospholipid phosphatase